MIDGALCEDSEAAAPLDSIKDRPAPPDGCFDRWIIVGRGDGVVVPSCPLHSGQPLRQAPAQDDFFISRRCWRQSGTGLLLSVFPGLDPSGIIRLLPAGSWRQQNPASAADSAETAPSGPGATEEGEGGSGGVGGGGEWVRVCGMGMAYPGANAYNCFPYNQARASAVLIRATALATKIYRLAKSAGAGE